MINQNQTNDDRISQALNDEDALLAAVQKGVTTAIRTHQAMGRKIPYWENNQVVWSEAVLEESQKRNQEH